MTSKRTVRRFLVLAIASVAGVAACVPPKPAATPGEGTATSGGGLSCSEVLACYNECGNDDQCIPRCSASASEPAQPKLAAVLECTTTTCQNDASCVPTSCRTELETCRADGAGTTPVASGEPSQDILVAPSGARQPHPNAGLLAWMTGQWIGTNHQFTFHADGRVRRASGVPLYTDQGRYACVSLINDEGIVRQEGDLFIMTFQTTDTNHCGEKESVPAVTVRYRIDWYDNVYDEDPNLQLILRDIDCTRGASMYCDDALRRR